MLDSCFCNIHGILLISHGKDLDALFLTVYLQLCDRCRTVNITGHKQWFLSLGFQFACQLGNRRCLTCTLKTDHHKNGKIHSRFDRKLCCLTSHQVDQLIIYDLDHHLSRIQTIHNILSDSLFLNGFRKLLNDLKVNIRFQKRHLNFLQCYLDISLCKTTFALQLFKYILQFIC